MVTLSPVEFDVGLLSALNLSLPTNQKRLRQILAKAANAGEASNVRPQLVHRVPQSHSQPDGFAPPPGLSPQPGFAGPDYPEGGECPKKGVSVIGDNIDVYAEDTSVGAGSMTHFASEDEPEAEEFEMNALVSCFVPMPRFLSATNRKAPTPQDATQTTPPPELDQVQQGGHRCLEEVPREQPMLERIPSNGNISGSDDLTSSNCSSRSNSCHQ